LDFCTEFVYDAGGINSNNFAFDAQIPPIFVSKSHLALFGVEETKIEPFKDFKIEAIKYHSITNDVIGLLRNQVLSCGGEASFHSRNDFLAQLIMIVGGLKYMQRDNVNASTASRTRVDALIARAPNYPPSVLIEEKSNVQLLSTAQNEIRSKFKPNENYPADAIVFGIAIAGNWVSFGTHLNSLWAFTHEYNLDEFGDRVGYFSCFLFYY
jgi:hypothetical protein